MRDAATILRCSRPRPVATTRAPHPSRYIQLRRRAAGLSIDQVAERLASAERDRIEIRALIRLLETPGTVARHRLTIDTLASAFPLDPDVYRQLATAPADRQHAICGACGCSANDPCHLGEDHLCRMLPGEPHLCSRCSDGERRR